MKFLPENGAAEEISILPYEAEVSFTTPTRAGYIFKGWLHAGTLYFEGNPFMVPAGDVEFVATWELVAPGVFISGYKGPVVFGETVVLTAETSHVFADFLSMVQGRRPLNDDGQNLETD